MTSYQLKQIGSYLRRYPTPSEDGLLRTITQVKLLINANPTEKQIKFIPKLNKILYDYNTRKDEVISFGLTDKTNLIKSARRDAKEQLLELVNEIENLMGEKHSTQLAVKSNKIFIVHGHDEEMIHSVARTLNKLGLHPVILREQPNGGRTIIEKFNDYSDVQFAVVLLSPDDYGYSKDEPKQKKLRARQNVIFEMGFFIGKIGRNRVFVLHKETRNFDIPTDYTGVLYTAFDKKGAWQAELVRELKASGYAVDANKLFS